MKFDTFNGIYFTGSQSQILIGDRVITEANEIMGTVNSDRIPIYGYASHLFNSMPMGHIIVTGSLTINYIFDGYLLSFINADPKNKTKNKTVINNNESKTTIENTDEYYKDITSEEEPSDVANISQYEINQYKNKYWNNEEQNFTVNQIRPEYSKSFTIKIHDFRLGTPRVTEDEVPYEEKIIKDVYLTQMGTVRTTDGSPVMERYSFYARQII